MTGNTLLAWWGPDPPRIDVAHLRLAEDRLGAHGTSTTDTYALSYRLVTGASWVTRRLDVRVDGDGWWRALSLRRADDGTWTTRHVGSGDDTGSVDEPEVTRADLRDALDCDLGLCPVTNTMPVLRHGLVQASRAGATRRVDLTMAWVSVPELEVVASAQHYDSGVAVAGGGAQIRYESGEFVEDIEFDAGGLVVSYPSIGRRIADHSRSTDASPNVG
jgi:uncharacterized protein